MLGDITVADEIYVICGYTDMRKSIDGLCAVVKDQLNMNPSRPNAIYLFCGRRSDRIKVLLHEREGFVLLYKRLDANVGKYRWPRNRNEVKPITWRQFDWLMSGLEIEQPKASRSLTDLCNHHEISQNLYYYFSLQLLNSVFLLFHKTTHYSINS